jgi:hypothetical protein
MVAQDPEITELGAGCTSRLRQCLIEIEALYSLALLADFEGAQQIGDLGFAKARERQIDI